MTRLEQIKSRADAATEGPWEWKDAYDFREHIEHQKQGLEADCENIEQGRMTLDSPDKRVLEEWSEHADDAGLEIKKLDAQFIAHARADVPWLAGHLDIATGLLLIIRNKITDKETREAIDSFIGVLEQ